jgi:peptide/nickel transport system substrate-binding protein
VNGSNSVGFENEEADQLMDEARTVFDRDKRVAMYHRFHEILHEEQPYTFMFSLDALAVADTRFDNIKTYPYGLEWIEWTLAEETQAK